MSGMAPQPLVFIVVSEVPPACDLSSAKCDGGLLSGACRSAQHFSSFLDLAYRSSL